ncbi:hypothetical protein ACS0TY_033352 [Phlomoides rotata]
MTYNHTSAFFLIAVVLFASTKPLSLAQLTPNLGLSVSGQLCCSFTGNCPGRGVPGVVVSLNCSGGSFGNLVGYGQNITDANGRFNINVGNLAGVRQDGALIPCGVIIQFPVNPTCSVLPFPRTNDFLVGLILPLGLVRTAFGFIRTAIVPVFLLLRAP